MDRIPQEVAELFGRVPAVVLGTAAKDGQPNCCVVGMKKVIDEKTVYLSDQFFKKTLANVQENQKVAIALWDDAAAYQIHGTAHYINEGADFQELKAWADGMFEKLGRPIVAKGGMLVKVDAVYQMAAGSDAGDQIA